MLKVEVKEKQKFRDKYAVKIDLRDAVLGGVAIYVTTYLLSVAFIFVIGLILWILTHSTTAEFVNQNFGNIDITDIRIVGLLFAAVAATALMSFFIAVLFEESFFSKHEKSLKDLFGLGLVWGMTVLSLDTIVLALQSPQAGASLQFIPTVRDFTSIFYLPVVVYIVCMPMAIYFLRKDKAL